MRISAAIVTLNIQNLWLYSATLLLFKLSETYSPGEVNIREDEESNPQICIYPAANF